jgi:lysozyme
MRGLTEAWRALVKRFEGWSAKPYICPAGYPTQGWGRRVPDMKRPPITRETGERWLDEDLQAHLKQALRESPSLVVATEPRIAAIADFCYNIGAGKYRASTLRRRVRDGDWPGAAYQNGKWVNGGGRKLPGLVLRRAITSAWLEDGA